MSSTILEKGRMRGKLVSKNGEGGMTARCITEEKKRDDSLFS
jgi:hypothetical protein